MQIAKAALAFGGLATIMAIIVSSGKVHNQSHPLATEPAQANAAADPTRSPMAAISTEQSGHQDTSPSLADTPSGSDDPKVDAPYEATAAARAVGSDLIAGPPMPEAPQRVDARKPLSELSLALPPKPKTPDEWDGTPLTQPVAIESARFQSRGYTISIADTESVPTDRRCDYEGRDWECGMRARTAVRLWLRGRALNCVVPPEAERQALVVSCQLGKQDAGAWLVANGWALATPGGRYADAQDEAERERKGIFGPPPAALPPPSANTVSVNESELMPPTVLQVPSE